MKTQQERSEQTTGKILAAAVESLVERGYAGASTVDVCQRAGVSRGALLHHYPTKADLLAGAVEHLFDLRHSEFRELLAGGADLDEALEALWTIYSGPTLHAWQELVVASRTDATLREAVAAVNERFAAEAEQTFRHMFPGVDEDRVRPMARMLMATLDGLALNHILEDDDGLAAGALDVMKHLLRSSTHDA